MAKMAVIPIYETNSGCFPDQNPLILNMDLFSEELEICDELIQLLKEKELIPEYTVERLKETTSRSSEIRCLLHLISSPEKGYESLIFFNQQGTGQTQLRISQDQAIETAFSEGNL